MQAIQRLTAQPAFGADLAGHAGHFGGKRAELVYHGVYRLADPEELTHEWPAFDVERHRLRQVSLGHGPDHASHLAGGLNQVADQGVDRVDRRSPRARSTMQVGSLGDLALFAHGLTHPFEFASGFPVEIDDVVEGIRDFSGDTDLRHRHLDREIALPNGGEHRQQLIGIERI